MKILEIHRRKSALNAIQKLNQLLKDGNVEQTAIAINEIQKEFNATFKVVNLNLYTADLLEKAKTDKVKFAQMQYFEKAASSRDLEYECLKYLEYKNQLSDTGPVFIKDDADVLLLYTYRSEIILKLELRINNIP